MITSSTLAPVNLQENHHSFAHLLYSCIILRPSSPLSSCEYQSMACSSLTIKCKSTSIPPFWRCFTVLVPNTFTMEWLIDGWLMGDIMSDKTMSQRKSPSLPNSCRSNSEGIVTPSILNKFSRMMRLMWAVLPMKLSRSLVFTLKFTSKRCTVAPNTLLPRMFVSISSSTFESEFLERWPEMRAECHDT